MKLSSLSVVPFEQSHIDRVIALWRLLHPEWIWLNDPSMAAAIFELGPDRKGIRYVVERGGTVIATVFTSGVLDDTTWSRNRLIALEAQADDISAEWVRTVLRSLAAADRGQPGTRQVLTAQPDFSLLLRPLLEPEGFSPSFKVLRIEWNGGSVTVADPGTIRFERYVGDSQRIDAAVVELHNRSFRAARPKPPISLDRLWMRHASLEHREFVLAVEEDRLVGYAEWRIDAGEAWIANYAVARSHWGTGIAGILCAKAMEAVLQHGHTKMAATIRSTNAAAMRQAQAFGWKIAAELSHTFVREF